MHHFHDELLGSNRTNAKQRLRNNKHQLYRIHMVYLFIFSKISTFKYVIYGGKYRYVLGFFEYNSESVSSRRSKHPIHTGRSSNLRSLTQNFHHQPHLCFLKPNDLYFHMGYVTKIKAIPPIT